MSFSFSEVKRLTLLCLVFIAMARSAKAQSSEERDFSRHFGSYSGAFVLYDAAHDRYLKYRPEECARRTSPCSTFKVLNSLIALECGVADGPDFRLP